MRVRVICKQGDKKVQEAFDDFGWKSGMFFDNWTNEIMLNAVGAFVLEQGFNIKIIDNRGTYLFTVSSKGFSTPSKTQRRKRQNKKKPSRILYGEKKYSVDEVLQHVKKRYGMKPQLKEFDGDDIKMNSLRLRTFKEKGCVCTICGLEGTFFLKVKNPGDNRWHFNLYGMKDGEKVLITKDHIMPRSKGGKDCLSNMQTMCQHCNSAKGDHIDVVEE